MASYVVGVDIGSTNVVVAVGKKEENSLINVEGISSQPSAGGFVNGDIENVTVLGGAIKRAKEELETELGIRINEAYAGIGGTGVRCATCTDYVFVKNGQCVTDEDINSLNDRMRNVVPDDSEEILARIPQVYYIDNRETKTPNGALGRQLSATYLFVLCNRRTMERVKMTFHNAQIAIKGICVNPVALCDTILSPEEKAEGVVLVDIGGGTTDITVVRDGVVRYFSSIPVGASLINKDLQTFCVSGNNTEVIKRKYGSAVADMVEEDKVVSIQLPGQRKKDLLQRNLAAVIEARLTDFADIIKDEVKTAKHTSKIPCGYVLTGGSALVVNIDALFHRELKAEVRLGSPTYGITEESSTKIATYAHSAAVAILVNNISQGACDVQPASARPPQTVTSGQQINKTPIVQPTLNNGVTTLTEPKRIVTAKPVVEPTPIATVEAEQSSPLEETTTPQKNFVEEPEQSSRNMFERFSKILGRILGDDNEEL